MTGKRKKPRNEPSTPQGMVNKMLTGDGRKNLSKQIAEEMGYDTSKKSEPTTPQGMVNKMLTGDGRKNPIKEFAKDMGFDTSKKSKGKKKKK